VRNRIAAAHAEFDRVAASSPSRSQLAAAYGELAMVYHAQDLPTRMTVTLAGQTVTVVYRDWGAPVDVTVPSADEVGALSLPTG